MSDNRKQYLSKYIPILINKAHKLGLTFITDISISPLKSKKYRVYLNDGTHVDFGYFGQMKDGKMSQDYLEHKSELRRQRFLNRWKNNPNINNIHSPVFYIIRLNW